MLIFENKGEVVGVSNPHPHGQIYATNFVFKHIETEVRRVSARHKAETGRVLFQDILDAEIHDGRRILFENATAIAFVPYFARYAYEVYVAPKATAPSVDALRPAEVRTSPRRCRTCWSASTTSGTDAVSLRHGPAPGAHGWRRLQRVPLSHPSSIRRCASPILLKYLAGPEIGGGNFLSDTTPEEKAAELASPSGRSLHRLIDDRPRLAPSPILRVQAAIRDAVVAACESAAEGSLHLVDRDGAGDTIYAVDRVGEERLVEALREGSGVDRAHRSARRRPARRRRGPAPRAPSRTARSGACSSIRSTARAASCTRSAAPGS